MARVALVFRLRGSHMVPDKHVHRRLILFEVFVFDSKKIAPLEALDATKKSTVKLNVSVPIILILALEEFLLSLKAAR